MSSTHEQDKQAEEAPRPVAYFETMIAEKEKELLEDLVYYRGRIEAASGLESTAGSTLVEIYRAHIRHIERLLSSLRD